MKILFFCTAHNSLSQRLYLALSPSHDVYIEFAISNDHMITAAELAAPDLIICPFLTAKVPKAVYSTYLTLIVHPGPPGDAGPSALDWVLLGDDGSVDDPSMLLETLHTHRLWPGRSHWGVTVLQAIEELDAGPVWAFEQFPIDIDEPELTKSSLYRGAVTRSAITAVTMAIYRIQKASASAKITPHLVANKDFKMQSVTTGLPFQGGQTHERPLLKAKDRAFDVNNHSAQQISRCIRCGDSQPGVLSRIFGSGLYIYGGLIDQSPDGPLFGVAAPGTIVAVRNEAICFTTCDGKGVWITHIRQVKQAGDKALYPKVRAVSALIELGVLTLAQVAQLDWPLPLNWQLCSYRTFQEVWVDFQYGKDGCIAYLYFDFYNGAMGTRDCSHLISAMSYITKKSRAATRDQHTVKAIVLMGGTYFSNGIALNIIEASDNASMESWANINRIDDVVYHLLHVFPSQNILTIAAIRGNAAAGGVAFAAACDIVIAGSDVVLNPAYRAVGLFGSEYHTISYAGRCGKAKANEILRAMLPISAFEARSIGLVDHVLASSGTALDERIKAHVPFLIKSVMPGRGFWKDKVDLSPDALACARTFELGEMAKDFFTPRAERYHVRRWNFVRKVKPKSTPLRFARHRRFDCDCLDEEEHNSFDDVAHFQERAERRERKKVEEELAKIRQATAAVAVEASQQFEDAMEKGSETVFSCYYKPLTETMTTPAEKTRLLTEITELKPVTQAVEGVQGLLV